MKVGDPVLAGDKKGKIAWIDNPWFHKDGTPADLLCKITFESDNFKWHRISEVKPRTEDIKENKMENIEKEKIEFPEFLEIEKKLEIKIGRVSKVEDIPKSNKLIELTVDFGDEVRCVVTNIKPLLNSTDENISANLRTSLGMAKSLVDKKFAFVTNLKPVTMMGIESTAMIIPGDIESGNVVTVNGTPGTKLL